MTACFLLIAGVVAPARAAEPAGGPEGKEISAVAIRSGHLIDGKRDRARGASVVLIEGVRIVRVGDPGIIPDGVEVIDLGSATLLPGLIDLHSHPDRK
jgi:imidazolonepropionase-like amidohydrolase